MPLSRREKNLANVSARTDSGESRGRVVKLAGTWPEDGARVRLRGKIEGEACLFSPPSFSVGRDDGVMARTSNASNSHYLPHPHPSHCPPPPHCPSSHLKLPLLLCLPDAEIVGSLKKAEPLLHGHPRGPHAVALGVDLRKANGKEEPR